MQLATLSAFFIFLLTCAFAQPSPPGCSPGTYLSGNSCQLCPPGTYQSFKNATHCRPCPAGYFNSLRGAQTIQVCNPCPEDTFSPSAASSCTKCPPNTVSPAASDRCLSCPGGTARTRCPINSGFAHNSGPLQQPGECQFLDGYSLRKDPLLTLQCYPCGEGTFSPPNSRDCQICPDGTTAPRRSTRCLSTGSKNRYERCPDGFRGNKRIGGPHCVPCPAGMAGRDGQCHLCGQGENTKVTGATYCMPDNTACPSNFFRNTLGACQRCEKWQRYDGKRRTCVRCTDDEQSNGGSDTQCQKCPPYSEVHIEPDLHFKYGESGGVYFVYGDYNRTPRCVC